MLDFGKLLHWIGCALITVGALSACTAAPTPVLIATSTIVPSTATHTPTPAEPSATPQSSATVVTTATPGISPLLEIAITPDMSLTSRVMEDLASHLGIPTGRVQLVKIEEHDFSALTLDCLPTTGGFIKSGSETIEGYRYVLLVGDRLYEYHTNGTEAIRRCPFTAPLSDELLILVDPFAADTLRLVQNRLAAELDISSRRILLVSMNAVVWRDTSLACPLEDQTYNPAEIVGYRIVVVAGEQVYIFHSDSTNVYPCAPENEVFQ